MQHSWRSIKARIGAKADRKDNFGACGDVFDSEYGFDLLSMLYADAAGNAAMTSTSTLNSGRVNPLTINRVEQTG